MLLAADPIGERDLHSVAGDLNGFGHLGIASKDGVRIMLQVRPQEALQFWLVDMFACGKPLALSAQSR